MNTGDEQSHATSPQREPAPGLVLLLAVGAGLSVAPLYYSQPMLPAMGADLHATAREIGLIPTLTQLGYAAGILVLTPLGDRFDRRKVIVTKALLLLTTLLLNGWAPSVGALLAASFLLGLFATLAQDIVPAAAALAPEAQRGRVVGTVMTGLFLGILLSRLVSGAAADLFGFRAVYAGAAATIAALGLAAWRGLPAFPPTTQMPYGALLQSLSHLFRRHPPLRRATLAQSLLAVSFSAFWSTLAVMLHDRFQLGSTTAGSFGLAGAAGALAAPLAGRLSDRRGPAVVTRAGSALAMIAFALMALLPLLQPPLQLGLIALSAVGFDFGIQSSLVAHQTIVYGIDPAARSRLNALLVAGMFIGMAAGSSAGSLALATWGWPGVIALATLSSCAALVVRMRG